MFKLIELLVELLGLCLIILSPTLLFGAIGVGIWMHHYEESWSYYLLIGLFTLGLCFGTAWAFRIKAKYGTFIYLSRMASGSKEIEDQDKAREKTK